jgi:hypothetical protein
MNKQKQKQLLKEIIKADEESGLYDEKLFKTNPVLKGKDAKQFIKCMNNPKKLSVKEKKQIEEGFNRINNSNEKPGQQK